MFWWQTRISRKLNILNFGVTGELSGRYNFKVPELVKVHARKFARISSYQQKLKKIKETLTLICRMITLILRRVLI